jgi:peptidoglycan biosynthesis protein MviN/MurJ (putative lipid II flippase)
VSQSRKIFVNTFGMDLVRVIERTASALRLLERVVPITALWNVVSRVLSVRGEQAAAFSSQIIALLVRSVGGYLLIRGLASLGAAVSISVSALFLILLVVHQLHSDGIRLIFFPLTARFALAAAGMVTVTFVLQNHLAFWGAGARQLHGNGTSVQGFFRRGFLDFQKYLVG